MKKLLLSLMSLFALAQSGMAAVNALDYLDWAYGSYPGVPVGADNTMPSFGTVIGIPRGGAKLEIPGTSEESEVARRDENGVYQTKDMDLLYLSTERVQIKGPNNIDAKKYINACYETEEWPTPFANGKQECPAFRFGFAGYEVSKVTGVYTVSFPAGAIYINGEACEAFTVTFNVKDETVYTPYRFNFDVSPLTNYPLDHLINPQISINNVIEDEDKESWEEIYETKGVNPVGDVTVTHKETNEVKVCPFFNAGSSVYKLVWEVDLQTEGGYTTPGTYIVNIPEGKIRLRDNESGEYLTNYALEYTFIVEGDAPVKTYYEGAPVTLPAAGNVTALQCIELNQPKGYALALPSKVLPFTIKLADGTEKTVTPRNGWYGHTIYVDLDAPLTSKGEYTLSIPEGGIVYFTANSDGDIADASKPLYTRAQTVKYNVTWGTEADLKFSSSPENGAEIYKPLENIYITFDEPITPTLGMLATLKWPDGTTVHYPQDGSGNEDKSEAPYQYKLTYSEANKRFMVGLHYPQMKGEYELIVPAGVAKTADGKINKSFTIKINWLERDVVDLDIQSDPKSGESLSTLPQEIYLTLPDEVTDAYLGDGGITSVLFFTPGASSAVNRYIAESGSKFYIDLRESYEYSEDTKGLYTVQMPEGSFICTLKDGVQVLNATKTYSWRLTASGVYEVSTAEGRVTVYDLSGNLLMRDADAEQLDALKGVYIVNGVKTVLR